MIFLAKNGNCWFENYCLINIFNNLPLTSINVELTEVLRYSFVYFEDNRFDSSSYCSKRTDATRAYLTDHLMFKTNEFKRKAESSWVRIIILQVFFIYSFFRLLTPAEGAELNAAVGVRCHKYETFTLMSLNSYLGLLKTTFWSAEEIWKIIMRMCGDVVFE